MAVVGTVDALEKDSDRPKVISHPFRWSVTAKGPLWWHIKMFSPPLRGTKSCELSPELNYERSRAPQQVDSSLI